MCRLAQAQEIAIGVLEIGNFVVSHFNNAAIVNLHPRKIILLPLKLNATIAQFLDHFLNILDVPSRHSVLGPGAG